MTDLTKLAEQLDAFNELSASLAISEAARILRSAAAVDVAGLMAMVKKATTAHYLLGLASGEWRCTPEHHADKDAADAALESALRLALAAREDDVFTALDMSPDTFRTEGGAVNVGKLRAAIKHPADYLPSTHWLVASREPQGMTNARTGCQCQTCRPFSPMDPESIRMILCAKCGNKRCPHATNHRNACTNSNEPGQPGSSYPARAAAPKGTT